MFDWCNSGQHDACPVRYQRWYHGKKKVGRKQVDAIVYTDEYKECDCRCHRKSGEKSGKKPKPKTRRKK